MKIHLLKEKTIRNYTVANAGSRSALSLWLSKLNTVEWNEPGDIPKTFASADLLGNGINRVVFDIGGNNYRMICKYWFGTNWVRHYVKWIGTHAEYTKLCARNLQYTIEDY
jgi:mRNA interferase HigB